MTCAPGTEICALFGHTALRYEDKARGEDWVFNYGMFSFNTPHFIYRFVKGETDYELGVTRYPYFEGTPEVPVWLSVVFSLSERMFPNLFPLQMVTARTRKKQVIRLMMTWAFNVFIFSCYL